MGQREKTKLEVLAEERDYKRRRQSYRAKNVHITKKSHTEVSVRPLPGGKSHTEVSVRPLLGGKYQD